MTYYAALDVSLRSTHACVIDEAGEIVALLDELEIEITKVSLEAGTVPQ
jgi:hypothetical protein